MTVQPSFSATSFRLKAQKEMAEAVSRTIPAEPSEATVAVIDNFEMFDQLGMTHGGKVSQVLMRGGLMSSDILQVQAESTTQATRSILAAEGAPAERLDAFLKGTALDFLESTQSQVESLAKKHKPQLIVAGFSAYSRIVDWVKFREIADSVGAYLFVDMAHVAGLVAVGLYPSPVSIADVTTTTTHKTLRGARGGMILARRNEAVEKKLSSLVFPGTQGGPLMHAIAGKAVALKEALEPEFKIYQQQVISNAQAMADSFIQRGYNIVSGGTDNHLFLVDLIDKNITGKDADAALGRAHITVNKNSVPNDPRSPFVTSGLRIGTPASTTRGFGEGEIRLVADWICDILDQIGDENVVDQVRVQVLELCSRFPVYADK